MKIDPINDAVEYSQIEMRQVHEHLQLMYNDAQVTNNEHDISNVLRLSVLLGIKLSEPMNQKTKEKTNNFTYHELLGIYPEPEHDEYYYDVDWHGAGVDLD